MKIRTALLVTVAGLAIAGCNRSINSVAPSSNAPQRLPSAPVQPVEAGQLPPPKVVEAEQSAVPEPVAAPTAPEVPEAPKETEIASAQPAKSNDPVTREGVSGTWIVSSDNPNCRMILAFTKWSGGYRAATRKCNSTEISGISAWDVKGQQVVLMDSGGNTVARLYRSGGERYDGTTNSGQPVSFTR